MRRVYYAFALRWGTHPLVLSLTVFASGLYGLAVMVNVASFFRNLGSVRVSQLEGFVTNAFLHTHFLTLLFFGLVVLSILSFNFTVFTAFFKSPKMARMQVA